MSRKKKVHGKEIGLTLEQWSEDDTQFPEAWIESLQTFQKFPPERVIGFRLKVYLAPTKKTEK